MAGLLQIFTYETVNTYQSCNWILHLITKCSDGRVERLSASLLFNFFLTGADHAVCVCTQRQSVSSIWAASIYTPRTAFTYFHFHPPFSFPGTSHKKRATILTMIQTPVNVTLGSDSFFVPSLQWQNFQYKHLFHYRQRIISSQMTECNFLMRSF